MLAAHPGAWTGPSGASWEADAALIRPDGASRARPHRSQLGCRPGVWEPPASAWSLDLAAAPSAPDLHVRELADSPEAAGGRSRSTGRPAPGWPHKWTPRRGPGRPAVLTGKLLGAQRAGAGACVCLCPRPSPDFSGPRPTWRTRRGLGPESGSPLLGSWGTSPCSVEGAGSAGPRHPMVRPGSGGWRPKRWCRLHGRRGEPCPHRRPPGHGWGVHRTLLCCSFSA